MKNPWFLIRTCSTHMMDLSITVSIFTDGHFLPGKGHLMPSCNHIAISIDSCFGATATARDPCVSGLMGRCQPKNGKKALEKDLFALVQRKHGNTKHTQKKITKMTFRKRNVVLSCLDSGKKNNCDPLKVIDHLSGPPWGTYFQLNPFETNKVGIAFTLTAAGRVRGTSGICQPQQL